MNHCIAGGACRLAFLVVLSWAGLTGCGSDKNQRSVSFMIFGDPAELAAYQTLVGAFAERQDDIAVELIHIPAQDDYRRRLATSFSSGLEPDVMLLNYRRFALFADQGGLEPLGDYLAQSELIEEENFFRPALDAFYLDDELWCIPQNISSLVVYYNRDLFDAAGIAYPAEGWTRDEFVAAARALTLDKDGDGTTDQYGGGLEPVLFRLAPFVWQDGGDIVDDPAKPTRLTLDSPEALASFQWFVDLQTSEHVVPDAVAELAESSESRFLNGRLAMYFNSRRGVPTYRMIQDFAWDVAPLPTGGESAGILHSDAYCMARSASDKEAAWRFIEFANSVDGQVILAASGRTVPSLRSVAESPIFLEPYLPPANSRVFVDTIPVIRRVPIMTTWVNIEETATKEVERAFYGYASVEEAARSADELTRHYFEEAMQDR